MLGDECDACGEYILKGEHHDCRARKLTTKELKHRGRPKVSDKQRAFGSVSKGR
jgi:hypothetical protein